MEKIQSLNSKKIRSFVQEIESKLKGDVIKLISTIEKKVKVVHLEAEDLLKKSR